MNEQRLNELAKLPMGSVEAMEALEAEVIITVYYIVENYYSSDSVEQFVM